ncbi:nipped-B isoform X2 [Chlorella sorokiniana]|uniref:Sister chromatid cohesion protein n=1 Tax=Chlorella sorokiniana TaxID=3076 RepID=A0A2P6TMA5_CHLSO|nr:nipped-B isoform X2 [Chlorella sorokiniana]|eukprot:PRW45458.1 nipped-B isoform X2 [Chlorella sorokiniana]
MAEDKLPLLRWPAVAHPLPAAYLGFPVPLSPTASRPLPDGGDDKAVAAPAALQDMIAALGGVDTSYLRPLAEPAPGADKPHTALQKQLAKAALGIFAATAGGPSPRRPVPQPAAPAPAPPAAAPPAAAAAAPRKPAASKPPAAKRARLANVAVEADRAAVETPAEEASKAAAAFRAALHEFLRKHEKEAAGADAAEGAENGRQDMDAEGEQEGEEEEEDELLPSGSAAAAAQLLRDVRRLGEEALRICRPEAREALRQVPLEDLLSLLRTLQRLVKAGAGRTLEPGDAESHPRAQKVLVAVEAAAAALHIMTVPDMPPRVYSEDAMDAVLDLVRFQLSYNIYPFHDARLRSATRPKLAATDEEAAAAEAAGGAKKRGKKARAGSGTLKMPPAMRPLLDRTQAVLLMLADLLHVTRVPAAQLLPLLRAAAVSLTVEGQKLLQEKAVRLLVAAFQANPAQWGTLLDELFAHVIPYLPSGAKPPRDFPASEDARVCIQMATAAVLQMIQACVDLPAMDCDPASMADCYKGAATCADYFWTLCFERLPAARATKAESDLDFRSLLLSLVKDLLAVAHQPAWPAAPFLLLRFAAMLQGDKGLRHGDQHVRQYCLDLLASLAAQLYRDEVEVQKDLPELRRLAAQAASAAGGAESDDLAEQAPHLLLLFLADSRRAAHTSATSARTFLLCQAFAEEVTNLQKQDAGPEELQQKLVQYRRRRDELEALAADVALDAEQAQRLTRCVVQSGLGRARGSMLQWLLDCLNPVAQASTTRAKAVRALGEVVQADTRVLDIPSVQQAVERALQDEAISVREAAVTLLGRHAASNQALALRLFNTLVKASTDPGTSVRKSAIKILWESCIRAPGFPRATDACKAVLMRSGDSEESIQDMVAKVFHSLWFTPRLEATDESGAPLERSAAERAQQLADVALAVYEAGGRAIHLPLDQGHPLVMVLRAALGVGARGDLKKEWAAGREVAGALLELFLTAEETSEAGEHAGFKHLLSLHAFVVTDVELCMPAKDPFKFVRSLAPYLKVPAAAKGGPGGDAAARRGAEALLCVLSITEGVLSQLKHCEAGTQAELLGDIHQLINRHPFVQVLSGAAACLATLACKDEGAGRQLASTAAIYASWLRDPAAAGAGGKPQLLCRFLYILGQLCRRGAAVLESTAPESGGAPLTLAECQRIFVQYCSSRENIKVAEAALGAIGSLAIARPSVLVDKRSPAHRIMKQALEPSAPELFKLKALSNLIELLRADEEHMMAAQQDAGGLEGGVVLPTVNGAGLKRKGQRGGGGGGDEGALQTQNGQGDTLSQSSSILQDNWDAVLKLATDTTPSAPGSALSPPGSGGDLAPGTHVRRRVVELMEIVIRGGLVGPWTALSPLMALCTDPLEEIRSRALRMLRLLCDKHARYMDVERLCVGVDRAWAFRTDLAKVTGEAGQRGWAEGAPAQALAGLSAAYAEVVQPSNKMKAEFLRGLLKRLRQASELGSAVGGGPAGAAEADPHHLAFCAAVVAGLPYKRGDEPCLVVQEINSVVSRLGEGVREELKRALYGTASAHEGGAAAAPLSPGSMPSSTALMAQCKASLALSMLLLVKEYLKTAYSINSERIEAFAAAGEKKRAEEKVVVSPLAGVPTHLDKLDLAAHRDPEKIRAQYKLFKQLMKRDSADYGHLVRHRAAAADGEAPGSAEAAAEGDASGVASPGGEPDDGDDRTPNWMEGLGRAPAGGSGRGRGRSTGRGRGGKGGRSTGGRSTTGGGRGKGRGKKRRKAASSEDEEEEEYVGSDDEYQPRPKSTRKRLPMTG